MRRSRGERGEGNFGCLVGLVFLAIAAFVAWKLIPIKIRAAEMRQEVVDQAKSAGMRGDNQIIYSLMQKADENRLPISSDNIVIKRGQNDIRIDVDYDVPVEFPGYKFNWHFHHHAENPLF